MALGRGGLGSPHRLVVVESQPSRSLPQGSALAYFSGRDATPHDSEMHRPYQRNRQPGLDITHDRTVRFLPFVSQSRGKALTISLPLLLHQSIYRGDQGGEVAALQLTSR